MRIDDSCIGDKFPEYMLNLFETADAVVQEKNLSVALYFALDCRLNERRVVI